MPANFSPGAASATVAVHAALMALASIESGLFGWLAAAWGGWTFLDTSWSFGGIMFGSYGLLRVVLFLVGALGSLLVLLSAQSLRQGHRRFLIISGITSLFLPLAIVFTDFMTGNLCTLWYLPSLSALPAAIVLFDAVPHLPPAPPREEW